MEYSRKSSLKWILTYLIIGVLAWVAIYYFFLNKNAENAVTPQNEQIQTKNASETADWKTYTDSEYGFEVDYPQAWHEVTEEDSKQSVALFSFCPNTNELCNGHDDLYVYLNIYDTQRFDSLQSVNDFMNVGVARKQENILVSNSPAIKTQATGCADKSLASYSIVMKQGNYFYAMHTYSDCNQSQRSQLNEIFNQMLSTFKFTK